MLLDGVEMVDKCPKCKENLITRTIKKELGQGSIFISIAEICPKCNWSKDLTGAGDIVAKPISKRAVIKPTSDPMDLNRVLSVGLIIIVIFGIAWAFYPKAKENPLTTPVITVTSVVTELPVPEVTPTGKKIQVKIDRDRGFFDVSQKSLKIKLGDEIIWENEGSYSLTLISNDGLFEDKFLDYLKIKTYVFKKIGTYSFAIKVRDTVKFTGTVVVEP